MHGPAEEMGFVHARRSHMRSLIHVPRLTRVQAESSGTKSIDETKQIFEADYETSRLIDNAPYMSRYYFVRR